MRGIEKILQIDRVLVPVIGNAKAFSQFIDSTHMLSSRVAIVQDSIFDKLSFGAHVYAVVYERGIFSDSLYLYDSAQNDYPLEDIARYFRKNFTVYYPSQKRQTFGFYTCFAYAIHDTKILKKKEGVSCDIFSRFSMGVKEAYFDLNEEHLISEERAVIFRKKLIQRILLEG